MGWTYEALLKTDVNAIHVGMRGRVAMYNRLIEAIFPDPNEPKGGKKSFAAKFRAMAHDHNRKAQARKRGGK